jgi:hypothetical protein
MQYLRFLERKKAKVGPIDFTADGRSEQREFLEIAEIAAADGSAS